MQCDVACANGECRPECVGDGDCSANQYCEGGTCLADICTAGTFSCLENTRRRCNARGDGYQDSERCDDICANGECLNACTPTNGGIEVCDGVDNNCDDSTDEGGDALCPVRQNSTSQCEGTSGCSLRCDGGFADTDGVESNGCEAVHVVPTTTTYTFVSEIHIPSTNGGDACCTTDLNPNNDNPDATIDNNLAALLGVFDTFLEGDGIRNSINDAIDGGDLLYVVRFEGIPENVNLGGPVVGDVEVTTFLADSNSSSSSRAAGLGEFFNLAEIGGFANAEVGDGFYAAGEEDIDIAVPRIDFGTGGFDSDNVDFYSLKRARAVGEIVNCGDGGLCSIDPLVNLDGDDVQVGGIGLSGALHAQAMVSLLNGMVGRCSCISSDLASNPMFLGGEDIDAGTYVLQCNPNVDTSWSSCTSQDGPTCEGIGGNIGTVCSALGVIGNLIDVDVDGNGVNESISMGVRLSLVPATLNGRAVSERLD